VHVCTQNRWIGIDQARSMARFIIHRPAPTPTAVSITPKNTSSHFIRLTEVELHQADIFAVRLDGVDLDAGIAHDVREFNVRHR